MKCGTEKFFAPLLLAAVLTAAGCASLTPRDRVAGALDADGKLYLVSDSAELIREGSRWYDELERKVAESESPRRDAVQTYLTALKMLCRFAGADRIEAVGLSSHREPDGSSLNRCAAAGQTGSDWPWNLGGVPGNRLDDLRKLPAETLAAASFFVNAEAAAAELRRSGAEKLLEYRHPLLLGFTLGEVLGNVSGPWQAAVLPPPQNGGATDWSQCGFYLAFPDRGGALYRRLAVILPAAGEGSLRLPADKNLAPLIAGGDGTIRIYSTPECRAGIVSPRATLGETAEFKASAGKLPADANGAFYFADGGTALGVWQFHPGMIELSSYSHRGTAAQLLRRMLMAPLALAVDRTLAAERKRPTAENPRQPARRPLPPPPPELMQKRRAALAEVRDHLEALRKQSGRLPARLPEKYAGFIWFGAEQTGGSGKLPLVSEAPAPRRPGIGVLFADGTIEFFDFPAASLKHLCSFLHTRYHYDEKEFVRLIRRAAELDAQKKGSRHE